MKRILLALPLYMFSCKTETKWVAHPKGVEQDSMVAFIKPKLDTTLDNRLLAWQDAVRLKWLSDSCQIESMKQEGKYYKTGKDKYRNKFNSLQELKVKYAKEGQRAWDKFMQSTK